MVWIYIINVYFKQIASGDYLGPKVGLFEDFFFFFGGGGTGD